MIITADTNIFLYSVDERAPDKQSVALELIEVVRRSRWPVGLQVAGEFYRAATRRLGKAPWEAAQGARNLIASYPSFTATRRSTERALAEAASGRFSFWDANLLSAAEAAGCTHMLTEDMRDGTRLGAIEVVSAFDGSGISARALALLGL